MQLWGGRGGSGGGGAEVYGQQGDRLEPGSDALSFEGGLVDGPARVERCGCRTSDITLADAGRAYNEENSEGESTHGWEKSRAQSEGESSNHGEMRFVPVRHD